MQKYNISDYVWIVVWSSDGETRVEYFYTEIGADEFIRDMQS